MFIPLIKISSMLFFVLLLMGCATIVSKSTYPVSINTTPPGAQVVISDIDENEIHRLVTPATIHLPSKRGYFRKQVYYLEYEKEGYKSTRRSLPAQLDPWYYGNVLIGGLIGFLIIDPLTGSMWKIKDPDIIGLASDTGYYDAGYFERD